MDTITIHQPWASMIALGIKPIETRDHDTFKGVKGRALAIHAGLKFDDWAFDMANACIARDDYERQYILDNLEKNQEFLPRGKVLCVGQVIEARWLMESDMQGALCTTKDKFGLCLTGIRRIADPPEARGRQGVWQWGPRVKYEFE